MASVQNAAGKFIVPSTEAVSAAAAGALKTMPEDFRVSITNAGGEKSYPISSFTYLLIYKKMPKTPGQDFVQFLKWSMAKGQTYAKGLAYAPLPKPILQKVEKKISQIEIEK
jgi:phosphate transport system substrate-binding protein